MSELTIWQQNAAIAATTPPSAVAAERHAGVRKAVHLIVDGTPGRAHYELVRSVQRQARIAGLGTLDLQPTCPCGGRCGNGTAVAR